MPHSSSARTHRLWHGFRIVAVGLLIAITGAAFVGYTIVRWAERQILSTDGWVRYTSGLPKNPDVSWALADKLTSQVFAGVPIEQKIAEVLPPRAGFLASPLSDQLQERSVRVTQRAVQSGTFLSLWTGANRLAMERFLTNARTSLAADRIARREQFVIDLANTKPLLRERLAGQATLSPALQDGSQQLLNVTTDLRTRREQLWQYVRTTDFVYGVLPALFAATFLSAVVLASSARRVVLLTAATSMTLTLIMLIVVRYFRSTLLANVQNPPYKPAVTFIYDSFTTSLKETLLYGLGVWAAILIFAWVAGPSRWAAAVRSFLHVPHLSTSRPMGWLQHARLYIAQYRFAFWTGIASLILVYLGFFATVTGMAIVNSLLVGLCGIALIQLLAGPVSALPRK